MTTNNNPPGDFPGKKQVPEDNKWDDVQKYFAECIKAKQERFEALCDRVDELERQLLPNPAPKDEQESVYVIQAKDTLEVLYKLKEYKQQWGDIRFHTLEVHVEECVAGKVHKTIKDFFPELSCKISVWGWGDK